MMNQDNEVLSAIRRQKAMYHKKLKETHNLDERKYIKSKIKILSEDESFYVKQMVRDV